MKHKNKSKQRKQIGDLEEKVDAIAELTHTTATLALLLSKNQKTQSDQIATLSTAVEGLNPALPSSPVGYHW